MPTSSQFFRTITHDKDMDVYTDGDIDKDYQPYHINRMLSQYSVLVFFADEMTTRKHISKRHQLMILSHMVPKRKRRVIWNNKKKDTNREVVMKYYNLSEDKVEPYMRILSDEQINELEERMNTGGRR